MILHNEIQNDLEIMLDDFAYEPVRAHEDDAGLDLLSPIFVTVPAHGSAVIDTGVHVNLPHIQIGDTVFRTAGKLTSKSGLNFKHNIVGVGTIDIGYTGSIRVKLYNLGDEDYEIPKGDKIIQLVISVVLTPKTKVVDEFTGTVSGGRGEGGFGSTGR